MMPHKSKHQDKNPTQVSSQAGFLKPTKASQRRSASYKGESKRPHAVKKLKQSKSRARQIDHSSPILDLKSAVEMYKTSESDSSWQETNTVNRDELNDAKKLCEELQKQINELKVNQENISLSMGNRILKKSIAQSQAGFNQTLKTTDLQEPTSAVARPSSVIRVNMKRQNPLYDASNFTDLSTIQAYNSTFQKQDTSSLMIKKLHTERDKYKHKVLKLQTELKLAKRSREKITKSPEISTHDLNFYNTNMIGEGQLAAVYSGTLQGKPVAVKKLNKLGMMSSSDRSYLTAEAGLLMHLQHRNVVKIYGVCSSPLEPLIVMELVNGKSLQYVLDNEFERLRPAQFYMLARDLAIGLAYLHNQKPPVLHLNLRPSNVLLDAFGRSKVTDYGFSKIKLGADLSSTSTLSYLAPELLRYPVQLTGKIDVYAYSILMWQCFTRRDPAYDRTASQILDMLQNDRRLPMPDHLPISFQSLISKCWANLPMQRPTFKEVILELETMPLPANWTSQLREVGVNRMDTSDLGSSSQGTNSICSHVTDPPQESVANTGKKSVDHLGKKSVDHHPQKKCQEPLSCNRPLQGADILRRQDNDYRQPQSRVIPVESGAPIPCDSVRYVPDGIQNNISKPVVIGSKDRLRDGIRSVDQIRPHVPYRERGRLDGNPSQLWREPCSKFDDKFHDFVNHACEAETASKRQAMVGSSVLKPSKRTAASSDHIGVHSLSTRSGSNSSNNGYSVYPKPNRRYDDQVARLMRTELQEDFRRSNEVLQNARRLLSDSPLKEQRGNSSRTDYNREDSQFACDNDKIRERFVPCKPQIAPFETKSSYTNLEEDHRVASGSSPRSDSISMESFAPLPVSLKSFSRSTIGKVSQDDEIPQLLKESETSRKASGQGTDKVTDVLRSTADKLDQVSSVLHSAASEQSRSLLPEV